MYVQVLKEILAELDTAGIDFHSAEAQTAAACVILAEMAKDRRQNVIQTREAAGAGKDEKAKPWRNEPATPDQLDFLKRHSIPHDPKIITKGQASDLIDERVRKWSGI